MPKLSEIVGMNYDDFWNSRARFRVVKGSRASKKSTTAALWFIHNMMKYPDANLLVVRKVFNTLKDSSYSQLEWAINKLGVEKYWKLTVNPLEITYLPTKQKILFRGLDDSLKITSIIVPRGYLCWIWCEEAYEISDEAEFDKLVMSIRGHIPASTGLFKQVTLTFNPWRVCWIKDRFFDHPNESVFTKTTTYKDNEFLGPDDRAVFEQMAERNPRAAQTAVFGEWGSGEGAIYNNWHEKEFNIGQLKHDPNLEFAYGLDFGYVTSYNAFIAIAVDLAMHKIYIYDELYQKGMTNLDIAKMICKRGYGKEEIWADCAEPKSIYELSQGLIEATQLPNGQTEYTKYALPNIRPAHKGQDSVSNGIQRIQQFEIFVHPRCRNTVLELTNYSWEKDKSGKLTGKPEKDWDHLCDALRYSMDKFFIQGHTRFAEIKGGVSPYAPAVGGITEAASEETEFVANAKTLRLLAQPYEPDYTALCASDEAGTCADTSMVITVPSEPVQRTAEDFVPRRKVCRIAATREGGRNGR